MTIFETIFVLIALVGCVVYIYYNRERRDFLEF
jgi:cbb3-type cytochrome oxidase subunit 3